MEELDYTGLYRAYSHTGRKPKTSPVAMFKILVYGSMEGVYAGRKLARACLRDVNYMWLLGEEPAPDHDALNRFRSKHLCGVDVSSERSDQLTLIPFIDRLEAGIGASYQDVTLDAGYESEENYTHFEKKQQTCYIKPQNYERSKTRKFKNDMNLRENMPYNAEIDEYTCQNNKKIRAVYTGKKQSKSGFEREVTFYECEDCTDCPYKKNCTRAKGNRKMQLSKVFLRQREESRARITSPMGVLLRMNRSIQAEGAFGVIKQDLRVSAVPFAREQKGENGNPACGHWLQYQQTSQQDSAKPHRFTVV